MGVKRPYSASDLRSSVLSTYVFPGYPVSSNDVSPQPTPILNTKRPFNPACPTIDFRLSGQKVLDSQDKHCQQEEECGRPLRLCGERGRTATKLTDTD